MNWLRAMLTCLPAVAVAFVALARADDTGQGKGCKAGWHMCGCKREVVSRSHCETEELHKKCNTCWGDIAQFQCLRGAKEETLAKACAEAKKTGKLVFYIGNTGG